jgi:hypothetical protein
VERSCEHGHEPPGSVKCLGNFSVAERLASSQIGLDSMEVFIYLFMNYITILVSQISVK